MDTGQQTVRTVWMRGGTSKALFFHAVDLPEDPRDRDRFLVASMGGGDPSEIDGVGGATSSTSKVAIIGPSDRPDADVTYTFGQVRLDEAAVDYGALCGNISAAVGPFAVDERLVPATGPVASVRMFNTNTNKIIVAEFPLQDGQAATEGNCAIAGVPGTGARIDLRFLDPSGGRTGRLLPTGQVVDLLDVAGVGQVRASLVDAANPVAFVLPEALGISGTELPDELGARPGFLERAEVIRSAAAEAMGLVADRAVATRESPTVPILALVSPPRRYRDRFGRTIEADEMDLVARAVISQRPHRAYPLTALICTAVAARLPGTLVNQQARPSRTPDVRVGHAAGVASAATEVTERDGTPKLEYVSIVRTARRLLEGEVLVRTEVAEVVG